MKSFVVVRVVQGNGCGLVSNHSAFDNETEARKCAAGLQSELQAMMQCRIVDGTTDTGLSVRELVRALGIVGIGHNVVPMEVRSADLVTPPPPRIILSS